MLTTLRLGLELEVLGSFFLQGTGDWYAYAQEYLGSVDSIEGKTASVEIISSRSGAVPAYIRDLFAACSHHTHYYTSGDFTVTDFQAAWYPLSRKIKVFDCAVYAMCVSLGSSSTFRMADTNIKAQRRMPTLMLLHKTATKRASMNLCMIIGVTTSVGLCACLTSRRGDFV
jgi:hypothetical protein